MSPITPPEEWRFAESGAVPNDPCLPVLLYRLVFDRADPAGDIETRFSANGWQGLWRNGVFGYHHYHSGAHEVLGVARGQARLMIGGEGGSEIAVAAGAVLVLPAGTGHRNLGSSRDFLVVGAYPPGQTAEIETGPARACDRERIRTLSHPTSDPIYGQAGPLVSIWREAASTNPPDGSQQEPKADR